MTEPLELEQALPAPPEQCFAAWTLPERVRRWLAPGSLSVSVAEVDARRGGAYRVTMRSPEKDEYTVRGVYREVLPNQRLAFTWKWDGSEEEMAVTVDFRPSSAGTQLRLFHEGLPTEESKRRHQEGWAGCLKKLEALLAQRT